MTQTPPPLFQNDRYSVWADRVQQGEYTAQALSGTSLECNYPAEAPQPDGTAGPVRRWILTADLSGYPRLTSSDRLEEALYNLSLEELRKDTAVTGTFDAGASWPGVWTRDVSYSILLSLAAIEPQKAKESLLGKVRRGRIMQDTGSGGSWPVSTDRLTWGLAAWEIYRTTGDRAWLKQSYSIVRDSVLDDLQVVVDPATGLARGESSFLDWREQTYPRWMQPKDIYQSQALGTNAVFYRSIRILALMCAELGEPCSWWTAVADRVKAAINHHFWMESAGLYGQYRYGGVFPTLSPRADAFGQAVTMLFDIAPATRQDRMLRAQPMMEFGVPSVFPQTPGIPPYHNDSVWPFVQAFWNLAAAKGNDSTLLLNGLAAMQRAAALFLTNKENFVASTGDAAGTAVNSDRQLWSVAGNLAMTYRVLFGMRFEQDGLHFAPVIPEPMAGTRRLTGFAYRNALLDIEVRGSGSRIGSFTLDGKPAEPVVPTMLIGAHRFVIELAASVRTPPPLHFVAATVAPETPVVHQVGGALKWAAVVGAESYRVYCNGTLQVQSADLAFQPVETGYGELQVSAVSVAGVASFLSEPILVGTSPTIVTVQPATGAPVYVELDRTAVTELALKVNVSTARYAVTFRYSNGAGEVNTGNHCAIRTLFVDGKKAGPIVMPQRGTGTWDVYGASSMLLVDLHTGEHTLELRLLPSDENMSGEENRARITSVVLMPIGRAQ